MKALAFMAALVIAAAPAAAQVRDRRDAPAPAGPTGTAVISGTVVAADDSHPLALANVVAIGAMTGTLKITSTDSKGTFVFTNLPADRYAVGASKPPYIGALAGAKRAARPGTPVALAAGQKVEITVALPRGAAIAGTLLDENGLPAANSNVILQVWKIQGDERVLGVPTGTTTASTDEQGRYRFYGVPPGEYLVAGMRSSASSLRTLTAAEADRVLAGQPMPASADSGLRAVPFFYPGTPRASEATPIVVNPGDERIGIDFRAGVVRTARVDGLVTTADGQPAAGANVLSSIVSGSSPFQVSTTVLTGHDGRFTFPPAIPGQLSVTAQRMADGVLTVAAAVVDTSAGDQSGLQLVLRPAATIPAQLRFDGATPPPLAGLRVGMRSFSRGTLVQNFAVQATTDIGTFKIERLQPGRYLIGTSLFSGTAPESLVWSLKSVTADDRDITDRVIEIGVDPAPKIIMVTYTDQWQQISGKLSRQSGAPATDETVIVFSADRAHWYQGSRRIATMRPGSDGVFSFGGPGLATLPPGDYLLAAVTDLGRDEQFDPSFLATLMAASAPITIGPGEKKTQDLVIR